jgi:hypothetical protein
MKAKQEPGLCLKIAGYLMWAAFIFGTPAASGATGAAVLNRSTDSNYDYGDEAKAAIVGFLIIIAALSLEAGIIKTSSPTPTTSLITSSINGAGVTALSVLIGAATLRVEQSPIDSIAIGFTGGAIVGGLWGLFNLLLTKLDESAGPTEPASARIANAVINTTPGFMQHRYRPTISFANDADSASAYNRLDTETGPRPNL